MKQTNMSIPIKVYGISIRDLHHIIGKTKMIIELSWIKAIIKGLPPANQGSNKDVVGAKLRKAILPTSATGTAIAAYST